MCVVAPLKIESGRYGLNRLPVEQRLCEECHVIEDEYHVIMNCYAMFLSKIYVTLLSTLMI